VGFLISLPVGVACVMLYSSIASYLSEAGGDIELMRGQGAESARNKIL
jgi:ABC-type lipoprotein release transport system permease subunit